MNNAPIFDKIKMAERLGDLRKSDGKNGKTYMDLSKDIKNKTGVEISHSMLMRYESTEIGNKERDIMNVKNAIALANYYNVSLDYILGLTDIRTPNIKVKAICEYTGLSEEAIDILSLHTTKGFGTKALSSFISCDDFLNIMSELATLKMRYAYKVYYDTKVSLDEKIYDSLGSYGKGKMLEEYKLNASELYDFRFQKTIEMFRKFVITSSEKQVSGDFIDLIDDARKEEKEAKVKAVQDLKSLAQKHNKDEF